MLSISATELARNTRGILDRVMQSGETVDVLRNNVVIAQIGPPKRSLTAFQAFEGFEGFGLPALSNEEGAAWVKDSRHVFDESVRDPWA